MIGVGATSGVTPGGPSLSTLQQRVLSWVPATPDSQNRLAAKDALNAGIDLVLNTHRWRKDLPTQDITLIASTATYDLNDDFADSRTTEWLDSNDKVTRNGGWCGFLDESEFDRAYASRETDGDPKAYTIRYKSRLLEFSSPPSSGFISSYPKLRLRYYRRFQHLESPSDVFDGPSEFSSLLAWYARMELCGGRDLRKADRAERTYLRLLMDLKTADNEIREDY